MTRDANSFSAGVDRVLWTLHPGDSPDGRRYFPAPLDYRDLFLRGDQSFLTMVRNVVNNALHGNVDGCLVEANLAVFGGVAWSEGTHIHRCHLVAIKTETCDLEYFYRHGETQRELRYFRLDLDPRMGPMFTHPHPHVHTSPRDAPRYALNGWVSSNVVVDFLEHVYLELFHEEWTAWAREIWNESWRRLGRPPADNPFERIVQAFRESQYDVLNDYQVQVESLKQLLRTRKDSLFPLRMDRNRCSLLAYPTA